MEEKVILVVDQRIKAIQAQLNFKVSLNFIVWTETLEALINSFLVNVMFTKSQVQIFPKAAFQFYFDLEVMSSMKKFTFDL